MLQEHLIFLIHTCDAPPALRTLIESFEHFHPVFRTKVRNTILVFLFSELLVFHSQHLNILHPADEVKRFFPAHRPADIRFIVCGDIRPVSCVFHGLQSIILLFSVRKRKIQRSYVFHLIHSSALINNCISSAEHPNPSFLLFSIPA